MQNLQVAFVVFLAFLIGVNCVNFENSTTNDDEITTLEEFDICKFKCGDDPYIYCKGNQDSYKTTECVCPVKNQVLDSRSKCTSWCTYKCGEDSNIVCSGDQTTYETTICGCKDDLNWMYDKDIFKKCLKCLCGKGEKCTIEDFHLRRTHCKECREGYSAVNGTCKGDCSSSPCKNGGRCRIEAEDITCDCVGPFTGKFCEKSVHCYPNPCKNGGTCTRVGDTFECACPDVYGGRTCSENVFCEKYGGEYCGKAPCHVSKNPTKVHCICEDEQVFDKATRACIYDDCHPNPCKNGGTCLLRSSYFPEEDPYTCLCRSTHMGKNCAESTWCIYNGRSVCGDEATCQYNENSGKASCIYLGNDEFDKKSKTCKGICNPNPCVHGLCIPNGKYAYYCSCFDLYSGKKCDDASTVPTTIIGVIVPLGALGIIIIIIFIRKRNQKLRMRSQHMRMGQAPQIAMPVRVGLN